MAPHAPHDRTENGLLPARDGWYVVNAAGEPMAMYHWETDQEDFLVLAVFSVGARENHTRRTVDGSIEGADDWGAYTFAEAAASRGAGVTEETTDAQVAYGHLPNPVSTPYPDGSLAV